jgi:hypothetical protein
MKFFIKLCDAPLRLHPRHLLLLMEPFWHFEGLTQKHKKNPAHNKRWYRAMAGLAVSIGVACVRTFVYVCVCAFAYYIYKDTFAPSHG